MTKHIASCFMIHAMIMTHTWVDHVSWGPCPWVPYVPVEYVPAIEARLGYEMFLWNAYVSHMAYHVGQWFWKRVQPGHLPGWRWHKCLGSVVLRGCWWQCLKLGMGPARSTSYQWLVYLAAFTDLGSCNVRTSTMSLIPIWCERFIVLMLDKSGLHLIAWF